jgi:hypothetical protein
MNDIGWQGALFGIHFGICATAAVRRDRRLVPLYAFTLFHQR